MLKSSICIVLLCSSLALCAQEPFRSSLKWNADDASMSVSEDSVTVRLQLSFPNDGVAKKRAVVLQPCVGSGDRQVLLQPLSIYRMDSRGNRAKVRSGSRYASGNASEMSLVSGTVNAPVVIETRLARESWMDSCEVRVLAMEWGWKDRCNLGQWTRVAAFRRPSMPAFHPDFRLREPGVSGDALRLTVPVRVDYASGGVKVDEEYGENGRRIDDAVALISSILGNGHVSVNSIQVWSWTSPEGPSGVNGSLCQRRLAPFVDLLRRKGAFRGRKVTALSGGEDWEGVRSWVDASSWNGSPEAGVIYRAGVPKDVMEKTLVNVGPRLWGELSERCFPLLRRFDVNISFNTDGMGSMEDVWRAYKVDMRLLSPHDFWTLMGRYPAGSEEWLDIIMDGADTYPGDETLNLNAACALMQIGRYDRAVVYLRRFTRSERGKVANAMWLMGTGRHMAAYSLFEEVGSSEDPEVQRMIRESRRIYDWMQDVLPWERN